MLHFWRWLEGDIHKTLIFVAWFEHTYPCTLHVHKELLEKWTKSVKEHRYVLGTRDPTPVERRGGGKSADFGLATTEFRAIDLSCRACGAGAGCWAWIPGRGTIPPSDLAPLICRDWLIWLILFYLIWFVLIWLSDSLIDFNLFGLIDWIGMDWVG